MSHATAWSALADRFETVAAESPIEYSTHQDDTTIFNMEVIRSRVLFRYRPDETHEIERIISIRADGELPILRMARVNRFRWLCWAAGVLLNPHLPYRPPEANWLLDVANGEEEPIGDIAKRCSYLAGKLAQNGCRPPAPSTTMRPESWWAGRMATFARLEERFAAPLFHNTILRLTIGQRHMNDILGNQNDPDARDYNWERQRSINMHRSLTFHSDTGGTIWGDARAVEEFISLSESAYNQLPAELQIGMGPHLFPSTMLTVHTSLESEWWKWGVVMWALTPSGFAFHQPSDDSSPAIISQGCAELTASAACRHISRSPDCIQLIREVRQNLASYNPWLSAEDRRAARLAVDAAYQDQTGGNQISDVAAAAIPPPPIDSIPSKETKPPTLTDRRKLMLAELLDLGAIGASRKTTRDEVTSRIDRKKSGADFGRDFAALKQLGFTDSGGGSDGGIWLTASGKAKAQRLKDENSGV